MKYPSKKFNPNDYLTVEEQKTIYKATSKLQNEQRNKLILSWLATSWLRIGEVLHIKVKHFDFNEKTCQITILKQAQKTTKIKPIGEQLLNQTRTYIINKKLVPHDYLFRGRRSSEVCNKKYNYIDCEGGHLSAARVRQILYKLTEIAYDKKTIRGLKVHPHRYRKSVFINDMRRKMEEGIPITFKDLQVYKQILGTQYTSVFEHYAQVVDVRDEKEFIKKQEELMK